MRKEIDFENWPRKKHYDLFKNMAFPHFSITSDVDVTHLKNYIKDRGDSFFQAVLYLVTKVANEMVCFRQRIIDHKIYEYDRVDPSVTYILKDDLFSFVTLEFVEEYQEFIKRLNKAVEEKRGQVNLKDEEDFHKLLFITSLPWIHYRDIQNPIDFQQSDSIPRICWGKYQEDFKGRWVMPVSIQVHHGLMDGIHVSKYFLRLEEMFADPSRYL